LCHGINRFTTANTFSRKRDSTEGLPVASGCRTSRRKITYATTATRRYIYGLRHRLYFLQLFMLPSASACGTSRGLTHNFHVLLKLGHAPSEPLLIRVLHQKRSSKPSHWFLTLNYCRFYWRRRLQCNLILSIAPKSIVSYLKRIFITPHRLTKFLAKAD